MVKVEFKNCRNCKRRICNLRKELLRATELGKLKEEDKEYFLLEVASRCKKFKGGEEE